MITGRFILITGGSSGIGRQLAGDLLRLGNKVAIAANDLPGLDRAISEMRHVSQNVVAFHVDVGTAESVRNLSANLLRDHGCPDILVNCAGFTTYRTFEASPMAEIEQLVNVNLLGAMRCTQAFLPRMLARGNGTIVNIASIAGKLVMTPNGVYSASKHGLVAWSETLRYELARFNIGVCVICPGRVETAFFDHETFRERAPRRETRVTVPVEEVSRRTIAAIESNRFLTFIPWYYGPLIWLLNSLSCFTRPIYARLLASRIEDLYNAKK